MSEIETEAFQTTILSVPVKKVRTTEDAYENLSKFMFDTIARTSISLCSDVL